jgi:hypothetical protein
LVSIFFFGFKIKTGSGQRSLGAIKVGQFDPRLFSFLVGKVAGRPASGRGIRISLFLKLFWFLFFVFGTLEGGMCGLLQEPIGNSGSLLDGRKGEEIYLLFEYGGETDGGGGDLSLGFSLDV